MSDYCTSASKRFKNSYWHLEFSHPNINSGYVRSCERYTLSRKVYSASGMEIEENTYQICLNVIAAVPHNSLG